MRWFFESLERVKALDRRRYDRIKLTTRINGAMLILAIPCFMLLGFRDLGKIPLWEFLVFELLYGVMFFAVVSLWKWSWRKD